VEVVVCFLPSSPFFLLLLDFIGTNLNGLVVLFLIF